MCCARAWGVGVTVFSCTLVCVFLLRLVKNTPKPRTRNPGKLETGVCLTRESYLAQVLTPCRDCDNFIWPFLFILPNSSMTSWPTWKKQRLTLTSSRLELRFYQISLRKSVHELAVHHHAAVLWFEKSNQSAYMQSQAGACSTYNLWAGGFN